MHGLERRLVKLEPPPQSQTPPCRVLLGTCDTEFEEMARQASELEAQGIQVMQIHLVGGVRNVRS